MNQLSPRAVQIFFLKNLFSLSMLTILFLIIFVVFLPQYFSFFLLLIVVFIIWSYVWAKLSYKNYGYETAKDALNIEKGVIIKKYVSIPYDKIQNVDVYRGLLARMFGVSDLHIQTAGMSYFNPKSRRKSSEGRLPALSKEDAENLRNELMKRSKKSR